MHFSETIVVCDIKVGTCSQLNVYMNFYEYQRLCSFSDLRRKSLRFNISNFFSLETPKPIEAKYYVETPWDEGVKVSTNGLWPRWPPCPYDGKNLYKSSFLEPKRRWHWNLVRGIGCSSTTKLVQWWPWVDLDLFYSKVKFGPFSFCLENA